MDLKTDSDDNLDCPRPATIEVFASRSTLHGISHMFSYERLCIKRCLWIIFFLGSLSFLVLVCVDRIKFYFQYPHVTKLDEITAPMMTFPAITFCNLNAFRFSRVTRNDLYHAGELLALLNGRLETMSGNDMTQEHHMISGQVTFRSIESQPSRLYFGENFLQMDKVFLKYLNLYLRYEIRDTHLVEESVLETLKIKADFLTFKPRPFNMREFYDRAGHDIKEMLLSCYYRGMECSPEDFKVVSQHVHGRPSQPSSAVGLP
ncbi:hypothetical protein P4O66_006267 [Electrophorus voltai]|uniref:Uncharacterized protein n=1 Tax=Electrophorus voltai TaxID=2609070 RepID=A0AAD8ZIN7_9TELE|nr:hypothetical protein P4O66_006267 [Electrophorus voltai]